jgi:tyrosinase
VRLGGPTDWALPYWNYSPSTAEARLPQPFRDQFVDPANADPALDRRDGSGRFLNHLFVSERDPRANAGSDFAVVTPPTRNDTDIATCLAEPVFSRAGGNFGFGGAPRVRHDGLDGPAAKGLLERRPHDSMHGAVAGPGGGFMGGFTTAPLDPIFWIHHCNVDRVWEIWRSRGNSDPAEAAWRDQRFRFRNAAGDDDTTITCAMSSNTRGAPFAYQFDDLSA